MEVTAPPEEGRKEVALEVDWVIRTRDLVQIVNFESELGQDGRDTV